MVEITGKGFGGIFKILLCIAGIGTLWFGFENGWFDQPEVKAPVHIRSTPKISSGATTVNTSGKISRVAIKAKTLIPAENAGGVVTDIPYGTIPWNTNQSIARALMGITSQPGSLMYKNNINMTAYMIDDYPILIARMVKAAEALSQGKAIPQDGLLFVTIMGNGGPNFIRALNIQLARIGMAAEIIDNLGYSLGEDSCMGTPDMLDVNGSVIPEMLKGSIIITVKLDGDEDLCFKGAEDNEIGINPDNTVYDSDRMNIIPVGTLRQVAKAWIGGTCYKLPVSIDGSRTGETHKFCLGESKTGAGAWTPADENMVTHKGNLVPLFTTREYSRQMPATLIGLKSWNADNADVVVRMLTAIHAGAEEVNTDPRALSASSAVIAEIFGEKDGPYWERLFKGSYAKDATTGKMIAVGGSSTLGLFDAANSLGLLPGSTNLVAKAYTERGKVASLIYPEDLPDFPSAETVINTTYLERVLKAAQAAGKVQKLTLPDFEKTSVVDVVVADKNWNIQFKSGSALLSSVGIVEMNKAYSSVDLAGSVRLKITGHTDSMGSDQLNLSLSEKRAQAIQNWLQNKSSINYPGKRFIIVPKGESEPIATNDTAAGRAENRRVQITMVK